MNDEHHIHSLIKEAKRFSPFGEPDDFGFETRLRSMIAGADPSVSDWIARFSWRFSAACLPAILGLAIFLTIQHRGTLPEGFGGLVAHWMELLPVEI